MEIAYFRLLPRHRPGVDPFAAVAPSAPGRFALVLAALVFAAIWVAAGAFRLLRPAPGALDLRWDAIAGAGPGSVLRTIATVFAVSGTGFPAVAVALVVAVLIGTTRGWGWSVFVLGASVVGELDVLALKTFAMRARPDSAFGVGTSFPSGHTANAALLGTVVVLLAQRIAIRILAVAAMIAMAWSRTALHAHWLTDVLAGLAVGVATAVLLFAAYRLLLERRAGRAAS
jgi:membrane-associated phospholipid phosphatase